MDSATLLFHLIQAGHECKTLSVNYGQRHVRELECAAELSRIAGVEHRVADLSAINPLLGENSLSGRSQEIPEGHYAEESMKLTVVPNRNMIFMSVAIAWAISLKFQSIAYGAHSGDHAIYPDCRPEFADAMAHAAALCDWQPIAVLRPLVNIDKTGIAALGAKLGVPFESTWTCYKGGETHCGKCGSCTERLEAFRENGLTDPVPYASS